MTTSGVITDATRPNTEINSQNLLPDNQFARNIKNYIGIGWHQYPDNSSGWY